MATYAQTAIDFSRLAPPEAIDPLDFEAMFDAFKERFIAEWDAARLKNPSLPEYTTADLESESVVSTARALISGRLADRSRVNDVYRALLAPLASGTNLEIIAGGRNIEREPNEGDANLLRRYLLSFDLPAAGSRDRYLFEAYKVWPQSEDQSQGLWDAKVNGRAVHGRPGDVDIVVAGPEGRAPTSPELALVRAAVTAPNVKPEAVSINVLPATRVPYGKQLVIEVPTGPDPILVVNEARARVLAAARARTLIGGEVPIDLISGAAYGPSIMKVRDETPLTILPDPYKIPVLTELEITAEIR